MSRAANTRYSVSFMTTSMYCATKIALPPTPGQRTMPDLWCDGFTSPGAQSAPVKDKSHEILPKPLLDEIATAATVRSFPSTR